MTILQINTVINSGSTGRIAENIGITAMDAGFKSFIAAGNTKKKTRSHKISIGNGFDKKLHGIKSLLFDRHGFGSVAATQQLLKTAAEINPSIIHLHNIHGYYLNIDVLFKFLKKSNVPIVWTFHDCWPFTGHCSYFDRVSCMKWQTECNHCPNQQGYPRCIGIDQSQRNYYDKRKIFNGVNSLTIVCPSAWLANHVKKSFLSSYPIRVIHNGVDTNVFSPRSLSGKARSKYELTQQPIILGVASTWDRRKGLADFIKIAVTLGNSAQVVLVGLNKKQIEGLPSGVKGIERTEDVNELAELYAEANVFVNPTYVDNFPTTNLEALACGTPVITYNTGGSPEAIDEHTGYVVEKGDIKSLVGKIQMVLKNGKQHYMAACRSRAERFYNKEDRYKDYLELYKKLLESTTNA